MRIKPSPDRKARLHPTELMSRNAATFAKVLVRAREATMKKGMLYPGPASEASPPSPDGEAKRYGGDPPGGGSTIIYPVGVRGYGGGSASRFSVSFLIKFETYELG